MEKKAYFLCFFLIILTLSGCNTVIEPADSASGHYATQTAMGALEYCTYMNKQLTIAASQMMARMTAVKNMEQSTCAVELSSAKESYSQLKEIQEGIKTTMPAKTYESSRDTSLIVVDAALHDLEKYIEALEENKDTSSFAQLFQNDFNELTSQCNLYNN